MNHKLMTGLLGVALAFCGSMAIHLPRPIQDEEKAKIVGVPIVIVYSIEDLPLWTSDGKSFEPKLLIAFIRVKLDANLPPGKEPATVKFFREKKSLIIIGTEKDHAQVKKELEELRAE